MNTIIIKTEAKRKEIMEYEGKLTFTNFIFNDFKVVYEGEDRKDVYLVHIKDDVTKITRHVIVNGRQKTLKFSYKDSEETGFEFVDRLTGDFVDEVRKTFKVGRYKNEKHLGGKTLDEIEFIMASHEVLFIEQLRSYIMNEGYNRMTNRKKSKGKMETVDENSNKNISNNKKNRNTVIYLLEDIIEYIGGQRKTGFHCTCECWSVRGHFRHYKNGIVKWIESYEKGSKRNTGYEPGTKTYKV